MQKIDRNTLIKSQIAGGTAKGGSSSSSASYSTTTVNISLSM